jgi:hypothetical protein
MKVVKEYFIATVISFEFLILAISVLVLLGWPDRVQAISSNLVDTPEILKHFALLPSAFAGWVFVESKKLLFPEFDKKTILQEWPGYWRLKVHFNVGLFFAFIFAVIGLVVWVLGYKVNEPVGFVLLLTSVAGGFVVVISVYLAKINISEILISANKE